jgi:hypothetical protein
MPRRRFRGREEGYYNTVQYRDEERKRNSDIWFNVSVNLGQYSMN